MIAFVPADLFAQSDSLVDCFPLAVGNSWTSHFYHDIHTYYGMGGSSGVLDTGIVVYRIAGKLQDADSTVWTFSEERHVGRYVWWNPPGIYSDSSIVDTNFFDLVELNAADHELHRLLADASAVWNSVLPFQPEVPDSSQIHRYSHVAPDQTDSLLLTYESFYTEYLVIRKQGVGITELQATWYVTGERFENADHKLLSQTIVSVHPATAEYVPSAPFLAANYPNPFNPVTTIRFGLLHQSYVRLQVFNLIGQLVTSLVEGERPPGTQQIRFDAAGLASGVYIVRMQADEFLASIKIILMK